MTTDLTQEDKYRKQAEILLRKMAQARALFVRHKPSVGYVGEYLLRKTLKKLLPNDFDVCQGFVIRGKEISRQCDVIVFRREKNAVFYAAGELKVINACSAVTVIEVKSSVKRDSFLTTLASFEELDLLGVRNKFIFVFGTLSKKALEHWLFKYRLSEKCNDEVLLLETGLYDWPDKEWLPNAVISLGSSNYFVLSHVQDDRNDWVGYASYRTVDKKNKEVSCLQEFFATLMDGLNSIIDIDMKEYSMKEGIRLIRM